MRVHHENTGRPSRRGRRGRRTGIGQITVAFLLAAAALLVAGARAAHAQDLEAPRKRQGYYMSFGVYGAATQAYEKGDTLGPWAGYGIGLRGGQLITRRFSLGLAIESGATRGGGQRASATSLALEAGFAVAGNLALRGGAGVGFLQLKNPNDLTESSTRGVAGSWFALGVSYDRFVGQKRLTGGIALTPVIEARYLPGGDTSGVVAFFGVDLVYWTGLPLNQLDLPPSEAWRARKPGE
jgi:hypothetical protein